MSRFEPRTRKQVQKESMKPSKQDEEEEFIFNPYPIVMTDDTPSATKREPPPHQTPETPDPTQSDVETPISEVRNPSYRPSETPNSRRKLQTTRTQPPLTRSSARIMSNEYVN